MRGKRGKEKKFDTLGKIDDLSKSHSDASDLLQSPPILAQMNETNIEQQFNPCFSENVAKREKEIKEMREQNMLLLEERRVNAAYRDRLQVEITKPKLKKLFHQAVDHLQVCIRYRTFRV